LPAAAPHNGRTIMFEFLHKLWRMTRPYRGRMLLGVLTGIIGGLIEPLMIATIALVYGLIFPSANTASSLLSVDSFRDTPSLVAKLRTPMEPLSQFLASQFLPDDWRSLTNTTAFASNQVPAVLIQTLNHLVQCSSIYEPQRLAGVTLSSETRLLLAENPQGERLIRLNRMVLEDAYPLEIKRAASSPLADKLKWAPKLVQERILSAQQALTTGVKTHHASILALIAAIPAIVILRSLFSYLNVYFLQWAAIRTITDLRTRMFEHLMNLSAGFFSRTNTGELMSRTMSDTGALQNIISNATAVMIKDPVTLAGLLAYLLWRQPKVTLISMVVMPLCMIPILIYNRKARRSARALQTHGAELTAVMVESFTGNRIVKAYNLEATVVEQFRATAAKFIGHYMRIIRSSEIPGPMLEAVGAVGVALVLLYLVHMGSQRPNGEDFLTVILCLFSMYRPLKNLTRLYKGIE
jgi:ABC-type multidrug transport system fused ATPase/permease subunit